MHKTTAPPPGVYRGVPFEQYLSWDAVSQSQLGELLRSPAHLQAMLAAPDQDLDALRIGRAVHCLVLEGMDAFEKSFGTMPDGVTRQTKEGKALWGSIAASGRTPIKERERLDIEAMAAAVGRHTAASALFHSEGPTELSIVWDDEVTGLRCKARHDKHATAIGGGVIPDLKTAADASKREFERTIFNYGYHRQGAFYLRGASALELPVAHYAIVPVEKTPPFAVAVYRLDEGAISCGDEQIDALLRLYKKCRDGGTWPSYPETVQDIAIPDWAWGVSSEMIDQINRRIES